MTYLESLLMSAIARVELCQALAACIVHDTLDQAALCALSS